MRTEQADRVRDVLDSLQRIDAADVRLHESHEPERLDALCRSLAETGALRNPPLAVRMQDGHYLIIDGAHRVLALQKLGYGRLFVQVVEPSQFQVEAWEHVVADGEWRERLRADRALRWERAPELQPALAELVTGAGERWWLYAAANEGEWRHRLSLWHQVVESYSSTVPVNRQPSGQVAAPAHGSVLVRFPRCPLEELERLVTAGEVLPAGVTRFEVDGRLLNVSVPLVYLQEPPRAGMWEQWIAEQRKKLRFYSRSVYVCES